MEDLPVAVWGIVGKHMGLVRPDVVRRELERMATGKREPGDDELEAALRRETGLDLATVAKAMGPWFGAGR